jgi:hypothetical protein
VPTPFRPPVETGDHARGLMLNTGRVRDQWHTMTRTGDVPSLAQHTPEPFLDMHPDDAARAQIVDGGFARIESRHGAAIMRVRVTETQPCGQLFAAMHWSENNSSTGPADRLVGAACDPISGQPELKATAVRVWPQTVAWHGLLLRRACVRLQSADYWCRFAIEGGFGYALSGVDKLAADGEMPDAAPILAWLGIEATSDVAVYADPGRGLFRYASFADGALDACLFVARDPDVRRAGAGPQPRAGPRRRLACGRCLSGPHRLRLFRRGPRDDHGGDRGRKADQRRRDRRGLARRNELRILPPRARGNPARGGNGARRAAPIARGDDGGWIAGTVCGARKSRPLPPSCKRRGKIGLDVPAVRAPKGRAQSWARHLDSRGQRRAA